MAHSKTPKLVIATRSRRGPVLASSRGSGGMLPREVLKIGMRRYAFFTILGYNFRKIRERICKVICTYIYSFYKIFEVTGNYIKKKECSTWRKSCIQRSTQQHSSWMFMPICRHHFFKIQVYVLVDTDRRSSAFMRPSDIMLRWSDLTNPRADFSSSSFPFFFFSRHGGARPPPLDPLLRYVYVCMCVCVCVCVWCVCVCVCHRGTVGGLSRCRLGVPVCLLSKISLHRSTCKTTFARLTQSQAISQSFRVFISFRSMRDTTFFHFSKLFLIQNNRFLYHGDQRSPWWTLQVAGSQLRNPPVKFRHERWLHLAIDLHPACPNRGRLELWPRKWFLLGQIRDANHLDRSTH